MDRTERIGRIPIDLRRGGRPMRRGPPKTDRDAFGAAILELDHLRVTGGAKKRLAGFKEGALPYTEPKDRLKWLLNFTHSNLSKLSKRQRLRKRRELLAFYLGDRTPMRGPDFFRVPTETETNQIQHRLRAFFKGLAQGRTVTFTTTTRATIDVFPWRAQLVGLSSLQNGLVTTKAMVSLDDQQNDIGYTDTVAVVEAREPSLVHAIVAAIRAAGDWAQFCAEKTECGKLFVREKEGKPAKYCSNACKQRAYRERGKAALAPGGP